MPGRRERGGTASRDAWGRMTPLLGVPSALDKLDRRRLVGPHVVSKHGPEGCGLAAHAAAGRAGLAGSAAGMGPPKAAMVCWLEIW